MEKQRRQPRWETRKSEMIPLHAQPLKKVLLYFAWNLFCCFKGNIRALLFPFPLQNEGFFFFEAIFHLFLNFILFGFGGLGGFLIIFF